jgi:hypothetical protein
MRDVPVFVALVVSVTSASRSGSGHTLAACGSLPLAMPREPPLDARGTLCQVIVRGVEWTAIFRKDPGGTDLGCEALATERNDSHGGPIAGERRRGRRTSWPTCRKAWQR